VVSVEGLVGESCLGDRFDPFPDLGSVQDLAAFVPGPVPEPFPGLFDDVPS
jgi:hypothetical protein